MSNAANQFRGEIRLATIEDCINLAPLLRQEDMDEVWESGGHLPEEVLLLSFNASPGTQIATLDGAPVCMFGVCPTDKPGIGIPWMLASDLIKEVSSEFLKRDKGVLSEMFTGYTYLYNIAWSRNVMHLRWLKWLGFTIDRTPIPLGRNNEIFFQFHKHQKE